MESKVMGTEITAAEMRGRAWQVLAQQDTYIRYLLGALLLGSCVGLALVVALVLLIGGAAGLSVLAQHMGVDAERDFLALVLVNLLPASLFVFGALYAIAFATWSQTAMSMAAVRGGLRVSHAFSGWGNGWRMVSLLLWQSTFISLWALLFIVPGVRAAFSYALAPYLLVDHPDWTPRQCIAESKRLMEGHRLRLFCLGFSFVGWYLLAVAVNSFVPFVGGIANLALQPYVQTATAAFYEDLLDREDARKESDPA